MLNMIRHGTPTDRPPLLVVHGLFGSARNWGVISKRLSDEREVIAVDQRNHGDSPRNDSHTYFDMAEDLAQVIDGKWDVLGHSMGGKAAMVLALKYPEKVNRLIVADIAPVAYTHTQTQNINRMRRVDLETVKDRKDAAEQMGDLDDGLQAFFLQSLDLKERRWKLNLDALEANMADIVGFPDVSGQFDGETLFLSGAKSDYVLPEYRARIRELFPNSHFAKLPGTGHWLHAEKPREFEAAVRTFLNLEYS
ncbi:alpha/beta hydrolase [Marivivens niveibacter]|uniref:Alpha/beta hydrolase n=1 Tax=Marivivens niveibacter TaxID=1930667 RepID=A0A251WY51_9RHOB|nr:alpha/beta fold hydrolase [Marivivens niveibacter]OUD09055.1 alpha/beta hydrolase [Marivivens niveibacter]